MMDNVEESKKDVVSGDQFDFDMPKSMVSSQSVA